MSFSVTRVPSFSFTTPDAIITTPEVDSQKTQFDEDLAFEIQILQQKEAAEKAKRLALEKLQVELVSICEPLGVSKHVLTRIQQMQEKISDGNGCEFPASSNSPHIFLTADTIYVVEEILGQGGQSAAYAVKAVNTVDLSQTEKVIKQGRRSYAREQSLFRDGSFHPNVDHIEKQFTLLNPQKGHFAVYTKCDSDLTKVDYSLMTSPVRWGLDVFNDLGKGVSFLHQAEILHRDLKLNNVLVLKGRGVVGDLGNAIPVPKETHTTAVTPIKAPPFIWKNLEDQIKRQGLETKSADTFSFGVMMQDWLSHVLTDFGKKFKIKTFDLLGAIRPKRVTVPLGKLDKIQREYRRVLVESADENCAAVAIFPERQYVYDQIKEVIKRFNKYLRESEIIGLTRFAHLAISLQSETPSKIPSIEVINKKMREVQTFYGLAEKRRLSQEAKKVQEVLEAQNGKERLAEHRKDLLENAKRLDFNKFSDVPPAAHHSLAEQTQALRAAREKFLKERQKAIKSLDSNNSFTRSENFQKDDKNSHFNDRMGF